jgi:hypothetical protein
MEKKMSAGALQELEVLEQSRRKLDRIHGLVEQYAVLHKGQDQYTAMISRAALEMGRTLLASGFGVLADHANQLGMWAKRGGATQTKLRGMRDFVAVLRPAIEREERLVHERAAKEGGAEGSAS